MNQYITTEELDEKSKENGIYFKILFGKNLIGLITLDHTGIFCFTQNNNLKYALPPGLLYQIADFCEEQTQLQKGK